MLMEVLKQILEHNIKPNRINIHLTKTFILEKCLFKYKTMKLEGVGLLMALFIYINPVCFNIHPPQTCNIALKHHQLSPHQSFSWYKVISRILK